MSGVYNANDDLNRNINQVTSAECDTDQVTTKKVIVYGWNPDTLQKVRITADSDGRMVQTPMTAVPSVYNVPLTLANTECSLTLPAVCAYFEIKLRSSVDDLKLAFVTGDIAAGKYFTIPSNNSYVSDGTLIAGQTIFFASPTAAMVAEVITYA